MPVPVDFGNGGEFNPGCSSFIQQDRNVVMEQALKPPDQATVLQNLLQCITPAVSPSTSIGSEFDSPRKSIMRKDLMKCRQLILKKNKQINTLQKKTTRMKKKIASMKTAMTVLSKQKDVDESTLTDLSRHMEVNTTFNAIFLKNKKNKKRPFSKYPPGARKFALTLHFYSPAAYKYLRKVFDTCLPHPNTLYQWYKSVEAKPGFTAETLERLKQKYTSDHKEIICALLADEMSIRQQKIWCGGRYEGLIDMGIDTPVENDEMANQAYVFLLVALDQSWKIPLAYFFIASLKAEMKANLIRMALIKCQELGVKVVSLTFDGCKSNISSMKLLGCKIDDIDNLKTSFKHPSASHEVAVFLDACHMVKLIRNLFESKKCIYDKDSKAIKWNLLCELNSLQQQNGLNLANKLTTRHIEFRNEIMKVKLATQLLSRSVAKAIEFCDCSLNLPTFKDSAATTKFIHIINDLFDVLNSRNFKQPGFKKPLEPKNAEKCFKFLEEAKAYLKSLTVHVIRKKTIKKKVEKIVQYNTEIVPIYKCQANTGLIGLLVCIESIQHLYKNVIETKYLSFLLAYKVSQDHLELFFGQIRSQGGFNNNPNAVQFKAAYKKILTHVEVGEKFTGNCIPLDSIPVLSANAVTNINNTSAGYRLDIDLEESASMGAFKERLEESEIQTYTNNCDIVSATLDCDHLDSELIKQIVGYISGFVVRYLLKHIKCEDCKDHLLAKEKKTFHKLIDMKDLGGLCYSSGDVFVICNRAEVVLRKHLRSGGSRCEKEKICVQILKELMYIKTLTEVKHNHRNWLIKSIIAKYVDIRLHYEARKTNQDLKQKSKRQLYNSSSSSSDVRDVRRCARAYR
ncbi:hypothetical protein MSG28_002983 [Choristoneura fumiferana]|uniref:Uncharacterized protein n=1 Tax=Choristoneura fumiferana TaxID=7141 RepID=A0ACC0JKD1_CHOFU|nr:hypothetical protein MSG28_002983 [Choristoneura fumiferana]